MVKSLALIGAGPVVLVHMQKVGIKYKKPLSLTSKKTDLRQSISNDHSTVRFLPPQPPILRSARLPKRRENGREIRAFRALAFVSGPPVCRGEGGNVRKSPAFSANIPVLERLLAETGLITTAAEVNDLKQAVSGRKHMPNIDAFTRARHHSRRITPVWRLPRRTGPRSWLGSTEKSVVPSATSCHR